MSNDKKRQKKIKKSDGSVKKNSGDNSGAKEAAQKLGEALESGDNSGND